MISFQSRMLVERNDAAVTAARVIFRFFLSMPPMHIVVMMTLMVKARIEGRGSGVWTNSLFQSRPDLSFRQPQI